MDGVQRRLFTVNTGAIGVVFIFNYVGCGSYRREIWTHLQAA